MNIETCQRETRLRHARLTNMCCCTSSASHLLVPGALQRRGVTRRTLYLSPHRHQASEGANIGPRMFTKSDVHEHPGL